MSAGGPVVAGWVLEERLGRGSSGEVWRARREHVDLQRALKLIRVTDQDAFESWRHEILRLEDLSHDNIVRFYDAGLVDEGLYQGHAWIATELCEHSLAQHRRERPGGVLSEASTETLLIQMLAALDAADSRGCVHRDVKPGNILWHRSGTWKLCDFGTARLVPDGASQLETRVVGTVPYMSPAAHHGRQDHYADLYALGVTVHEALCGRRLHPRTDGMTDSEYLKSVMDTPPTISDQLPGRWQRVVEVLTGVHGRYGAGQVRQWFVETRGLTLPSLTAGASSSPAPGTGTAGTAPTTPEAIAATRTPPTLVQPPGAPPTPVAPGAPSAQTPPAAPAAPAAPRPAPPAPEPAWARPDGPAHPGRPMPPVTPSPPSHPPSAPYVWPPYPVAYRPDVGPQVPWGRDPTNVVGRRLASFLLDGVVFWAAYGLLFLLALAVEYEGMPYDPDTESANPCDELRDTHEECVAIGNTTYVSEDTPVLPVLVLLVPVGMVLLEGLVGGSPGQLAVGLRTVRGDGRRAGLGRVVVRWLLWIVDGVPYCFPLVGLVVGLSTRDHQRVGDVVAGTYVVRRRDLGRPVGWSVGWSAFPNQ